MDLEILRRSVEMVVKGEGTYRGATGGWTDPPPDPSTPPGRPPAPPPAP
jgi:hypothetical protein